MATGLGRFVQVSYQGAIILYLKGNKDGISRE